MFRRLELYRQSWQFTPDATRNKCTTVHPYFTSHEAYRTASTRTILLSSVSLRSTEINAGRWEGDVHIVSRGLDASLELRLTQFPVYVHILCRPTSADSKNDPIKETISYMQEWVAV